MREPGEEEASVPPLPAVGPPDDPLRPRARYAWFAGLLEGRSGDGARLRAAVEELNGLGLSRGELRVEGARFSLLLEESPVPGERLAPERLEAFVRAVQEVVDSSAEPGSVESTLRCVEVGEDEVVETLFAPAQGRVQAVGRVRPATAEDLARAPGGRPAPALPRLGRRRGLAVAALLALGAGLTAWSGGLVDRVLGAGAAELEPRVGPFEGLLALEARDVWGNYGVTIRRGAAYPVETEGASLLERAAATTLRRAAVRAVADGAAVHVRLLDGKGHALATSPVPLGALLSDAGARLEVVLPGRIEARAIELALHP